jgi:hypothetical protein
MRKILFTLIFIVSISFSSCSKDDDDKLCLICEVEGEASDQICEGETDPDSGDTVTKELLEVSKALAEAFGATCTLR